MQPSIHGRTADEEIRRLFFDVRHRTVRLCEPLEKEDFIPQPTVDVSPAKWHIAHTTWFFEELVLKVFYPGYRLFDPVYGFLFNSYYNTVGERTERHKRGDLSRPTVDRVFEYRRYVDDHISRLLDGGTREKARGMIILGINHEQQHQELFLTDLKYTFSLNPLEPVYDSECCMVENEQEQKAGFHEIKGGEFEIGHKGDSFCFDNEQARHTVRLEDFRIRRDLVSNGDLIEFIEDGGYHNVRLWHSEGWDWVNREGIDSPLYWKRSDGKWRQFTLSGSRPVRVADAVCHVSFYEASAFAAWMKMRLPTEFEWEAASPLLDWGSRWEWTNSAYLAYPGFIPPNGAVGEYNGKFMVNQMVLRGCSAATSQGHSRATYRNFFHPHLRWQFTGIRLAK